MHLCMYAHLSSRCKTGTVWVPRRSAICQPNLQSILCMYIHTSMGGIVAIAVSHCRQRGQGKGTKLPCLVHTNYMQCLHQVQLSICFASSSSYCSHSQQTWPLVAPGNLHTWVGRGRDPLQPWCRCTYVLNSTEKCSGQYTYGKKYCTFITTASLHGSMCWVSDTN